MSAETPFRYTQYRVAGSARPRYGEIALEYGRWMRRISAESFRRKTDALLSRHRAERRAQGIAA